MRKFHFSWLAILLIIVAAMPANADAGDQAGWSVRTDPRGRAFLMWVPQEDGPRTLMLGCLRDADTFTTMSYAVGAGDEINPVKLTLSNGEARFEVEGSITLYPAIAKSSFISDLEVDAEQLQALGRSLLPVLEGPGDIEISMVPGRPTGEPRIVQIPSSGLASVLGSFREVCFR